MPIVTGRRAGVKVPANIGSPDELAVTALTDDANANVNLSTIDTSTLDLQSRMYLILLDIRRELMLLNNLTFLNVDMDNERNSSDFADPYGLDDAV